MADQKELTVEEVTKWMRENYRPPGEQQDALAAVMGAVQQAQGQVKEPTL